MSDFLNGFSEQNYKKKKDKILDEKQKKREGQGQEEEKGDAQARARKVEEEEENRGREWEMEKSPDQEHGKESEQEEEEEKEKEKEKKRKKASVKDKGSPLEAYTEAVEREEFSHVPGDARDEVFEPDPDSRKKKLRRKLIAIPSVTAGVLLLGLLLYYMYTVEVPDFVGEREDDVQEWGLLNDIYVREDEVYELEKEEGTVISQSPSGGERIFSEDEVQVTISKGPDPQEELELPDFSELTPREAEEWKEEKRADNIIIDQEFDEEVDKNELMEKEFRDSGVTAEEYRREDRLVLTYSRGEEEIEKDIEVPDFEEEEKTEAEEWADTEEVELEVETDYSDTVPEGEIIRQDTTPETEIAEGDEFIVTVSKGEATRVPSFEGLNREEAEIEARSAGVSINTMERYHNEVNYGSLIEQSIPAGTLLEEQDEEEIILYYSRGIPEVPELAGATESEAVERLEELNEKGAEISYDFKRIYDSRTPQGEVIFNTHANSRVEVGSKLMVTVSRSTRVSIGDYLFEDIDSRFMESEVDRLEEQNLNVVKEYTDSPRQAGTVLDQSIDSGSMVDAAREFLVLEISAPRGDKYVEVPDFEEKEKAEVEEWAEEQEIELEVEREYSDTVPEGDVMVQAVEEGEEIAFNEKLKILVSRGEAARVPCFEGLYPEEAERKANQEGININKIHRYHEDYEYGELIRQSEPAGTVLEDDGGGEEIFLYYSLGKKVEIPNLEGKTESEAIERLHELNQDGADLSYEIEYVDDSTTPRGEVLNNTDSNTRVNIDTGIEITVNQEGRVTVEEYVYEDNRIDSSYMQAEINRLEDRGLNIIKEYNYDSNEDCGTILDQSIRPGRRVDAIDEILILEIARDPKRNP